MAFCSCTGRRLGLVDQVQVNQASPRITIMVENAYGSMVSGLIRATTIALIVYTGLLGLTFLGFSTVPAGYIPEQDKGYLVVNAQLPDGASLERTEEVMSQVTKLADDRFLRGRDADPIDVEEH